MGDTRQIYTTTDYIYRNRDRIGTGAFSHVYKGVHKTTGEIYAFKVPRSGNAALELERETIALTTLQHVNIVRLYDIQTEVDSGRIVFVMEYCPRGSVLSLLEEPENHNGLHDNDIITFIGNLASALNYLTTMGFVHRDIKPGNILVSETELGRKIFKLSDFGSSKYIQETNEYESLTGTEEYLHPIIYERAFIDRGLRGRFTSSTDLWSLGATLAHVVLGEVPFRPFEGSRKNRNEMFIMISRKPNLAIFGRQDTPNGRIQYHNEIPGHCNISRGLRKFVVSIIRGLLKTDTSQWTLDTFCREASHVSSLITHVVLEVQNLTCHHFYTESSRTIDGFLKSLSETIGIGTSEIKSNIYHDGRLLRDIALDSNMVTALPKSSKEKPLVLMLSSITPSDLSSAVIPSVPPCPDSANLVEDRKQARKQLTTAWTFMTMTEHFYSIVNVLCQIVQHSVDSLVNICSTYDIKLRTCDELFTTDSDRLNLCQTLPLDPAMADYVEKRRQDALQRKKHIGKLRQEIKTLYTHLRSTIGTLQDDTYWNNNRSKINDLKQKALHYFHKVDKIWRQVRDRKLGNVSIEENQLRKAERQQLQNVSRCIICEWKSVFDPYKVDIVQHIRSWIRNYSYCQEKLNTLETYFKSIMTIRNKFTEDIVFVSTYSVKPKDLLKAGNEVSAGILNEHRSNTERLMSLISDIKALAMTDGEFPELKGEERVDDVYLFG